MAKRKTTTKSYRRRNFRKIASNYSRFNCTICRRIYSTTSGFSFDQDNSSVISLGNLLIKSTDFVKLRQMYQLMRITGIGIEIDFSGATSNYQGNGAQRLFAFLTTNDGTAITDCEEADNCVCMCPCDGFKAKRYIKFPGGANWLDTSLNELMPGKFALSQTENATSGNAYWQIKFKFYITFKVKN